MFTTALFLSIGGSAPTPPVGTGSGVSPPFDIVSPVLSGVAPMAKSKSDSSSFVSSIFDATLLYMLFNYTRGKNYYSMRISRIVDASVLLLVKVSAPDEEDGDGRRLEGPVPSAPGGPGSGASPSTSMITSSSPSIAFDGEIGSPSSHRRTPLDSAGPKLPNDRLIIPVTIIVQWKGSVDRGNSQLRLNGRRLTATEG